jgi:hypothetical protein
MDDRSFERSDDILVLVFGNNLQQFTLRLCVFIAVFSALGAFISKLIW